MSTFAKSKVVKTPAGDFTLSFYDGAMPITLYLPHEFDGDYRVVCPSQSFADGQECTVEIINPMPGTAPTAPVPFSGNASPGMSFEGFINAIKPNPANPTNPQTNRTEPTKSNKALYVALAIVFLLIVAFLVWYFKFK